MTLFSLNAVVNELTVLGHRTDDRMFLQEVEDLLVGGTPLEQLADRPQLKRLMTPGGAAGRFQFLAPMFLGE
jgi:muramidase (phage lysozyme)